MLTQEEGWNGTDSQIDESAGGSREAAVVLVHRTSAVWVIAAVSGTNWVIHLHSAGIWRRLGLGMACKTVIARSGMATLAQRIRANAPACADERKVCLYEVVQKRTDRD